MEFATDSRISIPGLAPYQGRMRGERYATSVWKGYRVVPKGPARADR